MTLALPSGKEVILHNNSGGSRHDIKKTYSTKSDSLMQPLIGEQIKGVWKLKVIDTAEADEGTLNLWKIHCAYE